MHSEVVACRRATITMKKLFFLVLVTTFFFLSLALGYLYSRGAKDVLVKNFNYLSKSGDSSCSTDFQSSISTMPEGQRLIGSCCSAMDFKRYKEQIEGLKKYKNISEIPPDPYDIKTGLARELMAHYEDELTSDQQSAYDYAMQNSKEKGPCCCKCWRWYVYGGLAKELIKKYKFTGQQITEVWNLSDGCGGGN